MLVTRGIGALAIVFSVTWTAPTAVAQTAPDKNAPLRFVTEVVVTPERGEAPQDGVAASVVVVDQKIIGSVPAVSVSVIALLPGFHVEAKHPFSVKPLLSSRGFFGGGEADYVVVAFQ